MEERRNRRNGVANKMRKSEKSAQINTCISYKNSVMYNDIQA